MKKIISVVMSAVLILCLCGCTLTMDNVVNKPNFTGQVAQVHASYIIVDGEGIGYTHVTRNTTLASGSPDVHAGDIVTVYYDGEIMETYPCQLGEVYAFVITDKASQLEISASAEFEMRTMEVGDTFVKVKVINTSDTEFSSGNQHDFGLQRLYDEGEWYDVPMLDGEFSNTTEAYVFLKGESELTFDWVWRYGDLEPGHYRVTKTFWGEDYYNSQRVLAAEFDVK